MELHKDSLSPLLTRRGTSNSDYSLSESTNRLPPSLLTAIHAAAVHKSTLPSQLQLLLRSTYDVLKGVCSVKVDLED